MSLKEQTERLKNDVLERMPQPIVQNFLNDINQLRVDKIKETSLDVGDTIPNGNFKNIQNEDVQLSHFHTSDYLILNFYRGGWCPYCNMELREYEKLKDDFDKISTQIVSISAEQANLANETSQKNVLTHAVLTDVDAKFMKQLGIVFALSEDAKRNFKGFGMDFTQIHGNENYELPVPAVYVLDSNFKVVFKHFEEDYMTRLEPSELLTIIKNLNNEKR